MRAIGFHWHVVQRDLRTLGFRVADMFTPRLTAGEVVSIVVAGPGGDAVRETAAMNMAAKPRMARIDDPNVTKILFDVKPLDEF